MAKCKALTGSAVKGLTRISEDTFQSSHVLRCNRRCNFITPPRINWQPAAAELGRLNKLNKIIDWLTDDYIPGLVYLHIPQSKNFGEELICGSSALFPVRLYL